MAPARPDLRVMVDANVIIAGSVWPRWPFEVLQHAIAGDFQLVLSQYVINQARRNIERHFPAHLDQFEEILESSRYELVNDPTPEQIEMNRDLVRDLTDVPVALAAINSHVDYLVSEDKDLTADDDSTQQLRFHLSVLISGTFLRTVMDWRSQDLESIRGRIWEELE